MRYTFITEKAGSTTVAQVYSTTIVEAVKLWCRRQSTSSEPARGSGLREIRTEAPIPVDSVKNVWCVTGFDEADTFFISHVVATV